LPDDLNVRPLAGAVSSGPNGGPFSPPSFTFTLANTGTNPVSWTLTNTNSWLTISNLSGTLPVGAGSFPLQAIVNLSASALSDGVYFGTLLFSNTSSHHIQTRQATLSVGQPDYFTEIFDEKNNDVQYQTLTFIPNGSGTYYAACRELASA